MKNSFLLMFFCLGSFLFASWYENYDEALLRAKAENKKLFLYFARSASSSEDEKSANEILNNSEFLEMVQQYFEFVYLDLSEKENLTELRKINNKKLMEKFKVSRFPALAIIDSDQTIISKLTFFPIQSKKFGEKVIRMIKDYDEIKNIDLSKLSYQDLKRTYEMVRGWGNEEIVDKTLEEGLKKEERFYFLFEKYLFLKERNRFSEATIIRKEIRDRDPRNIYKSFFRLAVIDFEALAKDIEVDPLKVISPLIEYVKEFGKNDKENLWQIEMIVSQYLSSKGIFKEALKHARASYKSAPINMKKDLVQNIRNLKNKIQKEGSFSLNKKIKEK